ncbi:hypothetical protein PybrP1_006418 [[Pythium] brassicae (nom. inval.)]|nr:hypothetical protein PybrP1_006418 [[Pythium] brassicae (nom. inval.)]
MAQSIAQAEQLVEQATASSLSGPEWALNMAVCDLSNADPAIGEMVVRALQRKLQDESPRVVLHALILVEALVKNGSPALHAHVGARSFLNAVAALTDGSLGFDVQKQSLLLIKQWADAFAGAGALSAFQDVYRQLKLQGADFPELENDAPVFTPPPSSLPAVATAASGFDSVAAGKRTRAQQLEKLHADLAVVMDKAAQLRDIWTGGAQGEALEDALDFLRQCQPRMNTLIEGGIMGKIDEKTLEKCLTANDHLLKVLEECRSGGSGSRHSEDLMSFDSPPRAGRKSDVSSGMSHLSLREAEAGGARPSSPTRASTLASMDDGAL